jgi:hypothetical protein
MPEELLLVPVIIQQGQYPLYDVTVRFTDRARKAFDMGYALQTYPVGNMASGLATTSNIRLPHHGKDIEFNIFFCRSKRDVDSVLEDAVGWRRLARATKVMRGTQELHREVSANFPRQQDGSIDWGEPGAQDTATPP